MIRSEEHTQIREAAQLSITGFCLWIHERQFPKSQQYWDGNWVNVTAFCWADGAEVRTSGPIVHLSEIVRWADQAAQLHATLSGEANLACLEPELCVTLQGMSRGQIEMTVDITPNPHTQTHQFCFEIDQSYLPPLIRQCHSILEEFPLRDPEHQLQHSRSSHDA